MTLEEVVYQINGELKVEELEGVVNVSLLDNIKDVCSVSFRDRPDVDACASGATVKEARQKLVDLLKGNTLVHEWPTMWNSYTDYLRIPRTLTADTGTSG